MSSILPFEFESHAVRVQVDDAGLPWFNANDICSALEFANPHKAIGDHVDADDLTKREVIDNLGRTQRANHVNESGLYALIFGSKKDAARRFKRWVTRDVLPSIRKTGFYSDPHMRLWAQWQKCMAVNAESKLRASFGSRLMLERKHQLPRINTELATLEAQIQPGFFAQ